MQPTLIIALLVATHIGMATARIRAWMVSRLGENRFVALYSLNYQLAHRKDLETRSESTAFRGCRIEEAWHAFNRDWSARF